MASDESTGDPDIDAAIAQVSKARKPAVAAPATPAPVETGDPDIDAAILSARQTAAARAAPSPSRRPLNATDYAQIYAVNPAMEIGAQLATGTAGAVAGGANALWDLATRQGLDKAADDAEAWQRSLTYQPRSPVTKGYESTVGGLVSRAADALGVGSRQLEIDADRIRREQGPAAATAFEMAAKLGPNPVSGSAGEALARGAVPPRAPFVPPAEESLPANLKGAGAAAPAVAADPQAILNERALNSPRSVSGSSSAPQLSELPDAERAEAERIVAEHGKINEDAFHRRLDASTLPVPITLMEGQATRDPLQWGNEYNGRNANPELMDRFNQQEKQLKANINEIREQAAPGVPPHPTAQGQTLLDTDKEIDEQWRAHITSKYQRLEEAAGGQFPFDGGQWVRNVDNSLSTTAKNYAPFLPPEIRTMVNAYREDPRMDFATFESNRTILSNAARQAERAGNGNAAHAIGIVRDELENIPLPPEAANLKGLANDARSEAAARFEYIRQNPSYKAAVDDPIPRGQASPLADNYVNTYIINGKAAHVANMSERWAEHQGALDTRAGATIDHLIGQAKVTGEGGSFAQDSYNRALLRLGPKMDDLVGARVGDQLGQLGRTAHYIKEAPGGSAPNRSGTFVAAAGAAGGKNPLLVGAGNTLLAGIEGWLNVHAHGIPIGTGARWMLGLSPTAQAARQAATIEEARQAIVQHSLRPGAGLDVFPGEEGMPPSAGPAPPPVPPAGSGPGPAPAPAPAPSGRPPPPTEPSAAPVAPAPAPAAAPGQRAPSAPSAAPAPSGAATGAEAPPVRAATPRGGAPSPGVQARSQALAQALNAPPEAIDGRVRALSAQIDRATRLLKDARTDAERGFHADMIRSLKLERDQVIQRNVLAMQNPKGGIAKPLAAGSPPAAPPPPTQAPVAPPPMPGSPAAAAPPPVAAPAPPAETSHGIQVPNEVLLAPSVQRLSQMIVDAYDKGDTSAVRGLGDERDALISRLMMSRRPPAETVAAAPVPRAMARPAERSEAAPPPMPGAPHSAPSAPPPPAAPRVFGDAQKAAGLEHLTNLQGQVLGAGTHHAGGASAAEEIAKNRDAVTAYLRQNGVSNEEIADALSRAKPIAPAAGPPIIDPDKPIDPELLRQEEARHAEIVADAAKDTEQYRRPPKPGAVSAAKDEQLWQKYAAGNLDAIPASKGRPALPDPTLHAAKAAGITTREQFMEWLAGRRKKP